MFAVGLLIVLGVWRAYLLDSHIQAQGARANATVLKKELLRSADGDSDYLVTYRFALPDGRTFTAQRSLGKERWLALNTGGTIEVAYSQEQPERNFPEGHGVSGVSAPLLATLVFGALAVLGAAVIIQLARRAWTSR